MSGNQPSKQTMPPQHQNQQPGIEEEMSPKPEYERSHHSGGRLQNKVALIPSTFDEQQVATFGGDTPMQRPGQPEEVAPAYVFLGSDDSSYISGQVIHVNGGEIVNG